MITVFKNVVEISTNESSFRSVSTARKYCLGYYLHFVYFTIGALTVIPCTARRLIALFRTIWSSILLHAPCHPRLSHLFSYTLLKYIGIRLYTEIINVKSQKPVGYTSYKP